MKHIKNYFENLTESIINIGIAGILAVLAVLSLAILGLIYLIGGLLGIKVDERDSHKLSFILSSIFKKSGE